MINRPIKSYVQLECTLVCPSVQRKHPSHYVQEILCKILAFPQLPEKTPIILPEVAQKPKVVGHIKCYLVQVHQAVQDKISLQQVCAGPLAKVYQNLLCEDGAFQDDLHLDPCNSLLFVSKYEITNPIYQHEELSRDVLNELVRVFCYLEVMVMDGNNVKVELPTLNTMRFAKVAGSGLFLRDHHYSHGEPEDMEPIILPFRLP